jgi:hypothetical protein
MNRAEWRSAMHMVREESGGLFRLFCIPPEDIPGLMSSSLCGDTQAAVLMRAVADTMKHIKEAPRRLPALCGCCPRPLSGPDFVVCVAVPERDDPSRALAFALCNRCGANPETRQEKALLALTSLWPTGRSVAITHPTGGRA